MRVARAEVATQKPVARSTFASRAKRPMRTYLSFALAAPRRRAASNAVSLLAVAALLATLAIATSEARASCGDYVHVAGEMTSHASLAHDEHRPIGLHQSQHRAKPGPYSPAPLTPSCQGPNCRRQLPRPDNSVPPVSSPNAPQWACCLSAVERSDAGFADRARELSLHPLTGHWSDIERPPRG